MNDRNSLYQLTAKLTNDGITFIHDLQYNKIIVNPLNKPPAMSWPSWQFQLKLIAYFNQQGFCICKNRLTNIRELHHAVISKKDVMGCKKEVKNLIHHTYNVMEICKNCHSSITRQLSIQFLSYLYGQKNLVNWYNNFPLKTKIYRIEGYLDIK